MTNQKGMYVKLSGKDLISKLPDKWNWLKFRVACAEILKKFKRGNN